MLWYGLKRVRWANEIKNLKLKNKLKTRSLSINFFNKINLNQTSLFFYVPPKWNIIFFSIKKNSPHVLSYLYREEYFFYLPLVHKNFQFNYDKLTRVLRINNLFVNNFFTTYWTFFKIIFSSFSKIFFKKLKFRGKGYYIYKNIRNTVAPQFGYSHMIRIFGFNVSLKFVTKTIIFIYGIHVRDILCMGKKILFKRPHNIFTGKGVRFSKQIIYKKTGKISTYR